jgi:hypothetical protein
MNAESKLAYRRLSALRCFAARPGEAPPSPFSFIKRENPEDVVFLCQKLKDLLYL